MAGWREASQTTGRHFTPQAMMKLSLPPRHPRGLVGGRQDEKAQTTGRHLPCLVGAEVGARQCGAEGEGADAHKRVEGGLLVQDERDGEHQQLVCEG